MQMIISEKQTMKLFTIAQTYGNNLSHSESMMDKLTSQAIASFLLEILNQQPEELKEIQ